MPKFDIWSTGYAVQRNRTDAIKFNENGPIAAESFDDVRAHIDSLPSAPEYRGVPTQASYYSQDDDGTWCMWGCRLSPDEATARGTIFG